MERNGGFNVMVVEDNPDDFELTIRGIKMGNKNANYIHFRNGAEALKFIKGELSNKKLYPQIRLIMLNLGLPKIDGFEVLKTIRESEHIQNIPVVILSASEGEQEIRRAYSLGANSYVIKPTRFENYISTVGSLTYYWTMVNKEISA